MEIEFFWSLAILLTLFKNVMPQGNSGWVEIINEGEVVPIVSTPSGCSSVHQKSVFGNIATCVPRATLVSLSPSSSSGNGSIPFSRTLVRMIPSHVTVDRCTGSCFGSSMPGGQDCQPSATQNITVQVMEVHTTFSTGEWTTMCSSVTVEKHLACHCGCRQRAEHCDPNLHFYDKESCSCQCKNLEERVNCKGSMKRWDPRICSCMCPKSTWRPCSTGYTYDFRESCSCVRTYSMIASGGLTFIVVFVAVFCIVTTLTVMHYRKKVNLESQRRVRSDSNIERLLREAFSEEIRMTQVSSSAALTSNER